MHTQFEKYYKMMQTLHESLPHIRAILKENWDKVMNPPEPSEKKYYHRIYDGRTRKVIDTKYSSMKEIVEKVYYDIVPDDMVEHYLIRKCENIELIIRLKCRGIITSYNEQN
jgi:hypothetical protein